MAKRHVQFSTQSLEQEIEFHSSDAPKSLCVFNALRNSEHSPFFISNESALTFLVSTVKNSLQELVNVRQDVYVNTELTVAVQTVLESFETLICTASFGSLRTILITRPWNDNNEEWQMEALTCVTDPVDDSKEEASLQSDIEAMLTLQTGLVASDREGVLLHLVGDEKLDSELLLKDINHGSYSYPVRDSPNIWTDYLSSTFGVLVTVIPIRSAKGVTVSSVAQPCGLNKKKVFVQSKVFQSMVNKLSDHIINDMAKADTDQQRFLEKIQTSICEHAFHLKWSIGSTLTNAQGQAVYDADHRPKKVPGTALRIYHKLTDDSLSVSQQTNAAIHILQHKCQKHFLCCAQRSRNQIFYQELLAKLQVFHHAIQVLDLAPQFPQESPSA